MYVAKILPLSLKENCFHDEEYKAGIQIEDKPAFPRRHGLGKAKKKGSSVRRDN